MLKFCNLVEIDLCTVTKYVKNQEWKVFLVKS